MIRDAAPEDARAIAALIATLGYEVSEADIRARLTGASVLVADQGGVVGVITTNVMNVLHRPTPVGRISMMVVAETLRGQGIGAALVAEAEARLKAKGCGLVEVTSNARRERAHAFYERLGYERTSFRFARTLQD
jgi:GNAT superfamily N-acetyltransferase